MSRLWTRSMPIPSEENYDAQPSNEFTQGQSSQSGNESALSQMCRLYEQSQQQHREIMNQVINMGNHHGQYRNIPSYLSYRRHVLKHFLTLTNLLKPRTGFEIWRGN